ncbi:hypothetical protein [Fodinicola feengrottensis]|uniref:hypothetical protein n=1 Tax=Fodinicola feengrottensis TaxID=435914 RepID=UPI0013D478E7|nr:hypothetical protein [Fodinicola feengrottensis]
MDEQPAPESPGLYAPGAAVLEPSPEQPSRPWWWQQPHRVLTSAMDLWFEPRSPVPYAGPTRHWKVGLALALALLFGPLLWVTTATLALQRGGPTSPVAGIDLRNGFGDTLVGVLLQAVLLFSPLLVSLSWSYGCLAIGCLISAYGPARCQCWLRTPVSR